MFFGSVLQRMAAAGHPRKRTDLVADLASIRGRLCPRRMVRAFSVEHNHLASMSLTGVVVPRLLGTVRDGLV